MVRAIFIAYILEVLKHPLSIGLRIIMALNRGINAQRTAVWPKGDFFEYHLFDFQHEAQRTIGLVHGCVVTDINQISLGRRKNLDLHA